MREVEAQPVGRDQRALLRHVIAEHLAQSFMQEMGGGMVLPDRRAPRVIDFEQQRVAELHRALFHLDHVHEQIAGLLLRIGDGKTHAFAPHLAGIADLAAALAVERRLVHHDRAAVAGLKRGNFLAVACTSAATTPSALSVS